MTIDYAFWLGLAIGIILSILVHRRIRAQFLLGYRDSYNRWALDLIASPLLHWYKGNIFGEERLREATEQIALRKGSAWMLSPNDGSKPECDMCQKGVTVKEGGRTLRNENRSEFHWYCKDCRPKQKEAA